MVTSPQVSWLFFKGAGKHPYLVHTGRASNAEKQPTGRGPEGCVENGPAAALLVGYVSIQICALLAPCRQPILNATTSPLFSRRWTKISIKVPVATPPVPATPIGMPVVDVAGRPPIIPRCVISRTVKIPR